ncbi:MAG: hypothetical protein AAF191_01820 [Verrucomicrobiota bacterium]
MNKLSAEQTALREQIRVAKEKRAEEEGSRTLVGVSSGKAGGTFWDNFGSLGREEEGSGSSAFRFGRGRGHATTAVMVEDDFTRLEGVDEAVAERLRKADVRSFKQLEELETMNEKDRARFAQSFGLTSIPIERWRWAWTGGDPPPLSNGSREDHGNGNRPFPQGDELIRIQGIDLAMQTSLHGIGVSRFQQIANWSQSDVREVSEKLDLGDVILTQRWIPQARDLARAVQASGATKPQTSPLAAGGATPLRIDYQRILRTEFAGEVGPLVDRTWGIRYPQKPELTDDLKRIRGISKEAEAQLNQVGVWRYKQIAHWDEKVKSAAAKHLRLAPEFLNSAKWTQRARELHREVYPRETTWETPVPTLVEVQQRVREEFEGEPVRVDGELGILYPKRPQQVDPLAKVRGIGPVTVQQLNDLGIYRLKQIASWSEHNVLRIATRVQLFPDRIFRDHWIKQAVDLYPQEEKLTQREPLLAGSVAPRNQGPDTVIDQQTALRTAFAGETGLRIDPRFGIIYGSPPLFRDDLSRIKGVDAGLANQMRALGIHRFRQIEFWTERNIGQIAAQIGTEKAKIRKEDWLQQGRVLADEVCRLQNGWSGANPPRAEMEERVRSQFPNQPVQIDDELGVIYREAPVKGDELTLIRGIDAKLAQRLQATGIHRFRQIANWTPLHLEGVAKRLGFPKVQPYYQAWVSQASQLITQGKEVVPEFPEASGVGALAEESGASFHENFGYIFPNRPDQQDDLKLIRGVDSRVASILQQQGIYRFWQIAHWTEGHRENLAKRMGVGNQPREQRWISQARKLAILADAAKESRYAAAAEVDQFFVIKEEFEGEAGVRVDPRLGVIYDAGPSVRDPLNLIQGLEPAQEKALRGLGICRFKQVSSWNDENVSRLAAKLGIPKEVIEQRKWIPQAVELERNLYVAAKRWSVDAPSLREYEALIQEAFATEQVRADEDLGVLYRGRPARVDVLTRIQGIDEPLEQRLYASGVYRYPQMASWSAANVEAFARLLRIPKDRIYVERWIAQAGTAQPSAVVEPEEKKSATGKTDYFAILEEHFSREKNVRVDLRYGIVFDAAPKDVDDLSRIAGLEPGHRALLNRMGVYRFLQIAHWSPETVRDFGRQLQIPEDRIAREKWPSQAAQLHQQLFGGFPSWTTARPSMAEYEQKMATEFAGESVFADPDLAILYRGRPSRPDDLTRIQGVDENMGARLQAYGVHRLKQVAHWSMAAAESFEDLLDLPPGRVSRQRWVPQAIQLMRQPGPEEAKGESAPAGLQRKVDQVAALDAYFAGDAARVDRRHGIVYGQKPEVLDDLSLLRGVSPQHQQMLHRFGVYRFKQIAHWNDENIEILGREIGVDPKVILEQDWTEQAATLHNDIYSASSIWKDARPSVEDYKREIAEDFEGEPVRADEAFGIIYTGRPRRVDDLTTIQGVSKQAAKRLHASGVYCFEQIARWSEANVEAFAGWLSLSADQIYRDRWIGQATTFQAGERSAGPATDPFPGLGWIESGEDGVTWSEEFGYLFTELPPSRDDLSVIRGIDDAMEQRLMSQGVHRYWQIASWSKEHAANFAKRLNREGLLPRERWVEQARIWAQLAQADASESFRAPAVVDQFVAIDDDFPDEVGEVRADPAFGIVYDEQPEVLDDLTEIEGINSEIQERLQDRGVYRFKQMANWSQANVVSYARILPVTQEEMEGWKWIPQARWLHLQAYGPGKAWTVDEPTVDEIEARIPATFPNERTKADGEFGVVFAGRPSHLDDLTDIKGVDSTLARKLNASGIYCFRQVELWAGKHVRAHASRLELPADLILKQRWMDQASEMDCQYPKIRKATEESVRPIERTRAELMEDGQAERDSRFGLVYRRRPSYVDRLHAIKGVGAKMESRLNDLGIFRYRQIANWTDRNIRSISDTLRLSGRVERERWVAQAAELAELTEAEGLDVFLAPEKVDQIAILDAEFSQEESARVDAYLGIVFDGTPRVVDDLTLIDGVGGRMEKELNALGVYRYNQISSWSALNVAHFARQLYCDQERIERDKWIPQAKRLFRETYSASWCWGVSHPTLAEYQTRIEEDFSTEAVRADAALGIVYTGWPTVVDPLIQIQGITPELERDLFSLGVYRFRQLANWSEANVEEVAQRLECTQQKIYRDRWIAQAATLDGREPQPIQPVIEGVDPRLVEVLSGEPGIRVDEYFGFLFTSIPPEQDDLRSIRGIGSRELQKLQEMGIFRFRQIACWSERNAHAMASRLGLDERIDREDWVRQAQELAAAQEAESGRFFVAPSNVDHEAALREEFQNDPSVSIDPKLGIIYLHPPVFRDDLIQISGIGDKISDELRELGVHRYLQIALWSDLNVAEFAERLFCYKDRIERDKWVPQARRLHRETYAASSEWGVSRPSLEEYEEMIAEKFPGEVLRADRDLGMLFVGSPVQQDPLAEIPGVSEEQARILQEKGVYRFRQIATWSEANVQGFADLLRTSPEQIYREGWIRSAEALQEHLPRAGWDPAEVTLEPQLPLVSPEPLMESDPINDRLRQARREEQKLREETARLEAARQKKIEDLEELARAERERELEAERLRKALKSEEDEARSRLESIRHQRESWEREQEERQRDEQLRLKREEQRRLEELEREETELKAREEARLRDEQRERKRREKEEKARERAEKERLEREERERKLREELERKAIDEHKVVDRRSSRSESDSDFDDQLGWVFRRMPSRVDDLLLIRGIGPRLQSELYELGIYQFGQIAKWNREQMDAVGERLRITGRPSRENWIGQAKTMAQIVREEEAETYLAPERVDVARVIQEDFMGEEVMPDDDLGILYQIEPEVVDDLTLIRGVAQKLESSLHDYGVYRFKQIANWTDRNVAEFAKRLDCFKDRIERDKWIPQAKRMQWEVYSASPEWGVDRPSAPVLRAKIAEIFPGEEVVADAELGIVYRSRPSQPDDLEQIDGISGVFEKELGRLGIYRFQQIALWSATAVKEVARVLGCPADQIYKERWITQAWECSQQGGTDGPLEIVGAAKEEDQQALLGKLNADAEIDAELGIVYRSRPDSIDELRKIRGVGQKIERSLNDFGVFQYQQIAMWTAKNAEEFATRLNAFQDRMFRDNWMDQARALHEEKYGEKLG